MVDYTFYIQIALLIANIILLFLHRRWFKKTQRERRKITKRARQVAKAEAQMFARQPNAMLGLFPILRKFLSPESWPDKLSDGESSE